jgi:hypothetical protein
MATKIVEARMELEKLLGWFAARGRILVGYNSSRFDVPLIQGVLKGIDPFAPAQAIIKGDKLPAALTNLPEFPCNHIDLSARLRRGGSFPSLKTVAANLGRPVLRELPFAPDTLLTDEQWDEVKKYNLVDLQHTWALLEKLAPELQALAALSTEQKQDLRSVSTPQIVEQVFLKAYRDEHGRELASVGERREVRYRPVDGVTRPRNPDAADWFDRITNRPIPMVRRGDRSKPEVPPAKFTIGKCVLSVGSGGLHSVDSPGVYYSTKQHRLISADVQSFYPSLIAQKGIGPAVYGDTGRETYRSLLKRRLAIKQAAKETQDAAQRERLDIQADGLKLVLNSFVGKTGAPHSSLYDAGAFLAVTLSGQLMLIDLIERLTDVNVEVLSANTDGLFLHVPRSDRSWREVLKQWQADTGMRLDVEPLKRLAILASNQYATRDRSDKVKRKGGELRGSLDWTHSPNTLVINDAVANAFLFDIPPERTIFECRDLVRFCSVTKRSRKATSMVLVEGDRETELPKVTRWYRSQDGSRRIESRFSGDRHATASGAQSVTICQDIPENGLPSDIDWAWYRGQARRKIQSVPGYYHRSARRLLDHAPAIEVVRAGLLPVPKQGKAQPAGSDVKHPTLLWDWPSYPTTGCYTGSQVGTLVIDVDDPAKFRRFVESGNSPLFANRWTSLESALVSFHENATPDGVRTGKDRGKLIFRFDGDPDHPLCRVKAKWKNSRGIEVFYGNGLPSILGQYGDDGDQYKLDGTLGTAPDWLVEGLTPKQNQPKAKPPVMTPEARQEALSGIPAVLAELCPELAASSVGWRRKDVSDGREIWVGRCPFEHDSGRAEDGDLDAGYHDDGPYVRCLHGSCVRIQEVNRTLKERHKREHPPEPTPNRAGESPAAPVDQPDQDSPPAAPSKDAYETQAQMLLRIASSAALYHTAEGRAYASVPINGHTENHEVRSRGFGHWLKHAFYAEQGKPPSSEAMQGALGIIEAKAHFDGPQQEVYVRVAPGGESVFLDLGDSSWRVIDIQADGWSVVDSAPVRFRRPAGLRELPMPRRGGSADSLKPFVNLSDDEFVLLWVWLTAALRPVGPYPILALIGEQGSAKSTLARLARRVIDPHVSLLRGEPKEPRDLMITACNSWVVTIDNVSSIRPWLSDSLCRLATGGGFATRTLYSNDEETFLDAQRPVILTGIEDFVTRGDLVDRCLFLHLPAIEEAKRRTEADFWREFEAEYPAILGAFLDAVARALRRLPDVRITMLPRMADFARWGVAVGLVMGWPPGKFLDAYTENRKSANEAILEDSPVAGAIRELVTGGTWTGTPTQLMDALVGIVGDKVVGSKRWPRSARGLSGAVRRLATQLRMAGVCVGFPDRENRRRLITISLQETVGNQPSPPSPPSPPSKSPHQSGDGRDWQPSPTVTQPSPTSPGKTQGRDGCDGCDGRIPTLSDEPPF